jgi:hypothetical protein
MFFGLLDPDPNPLVRGMDPDLTLLKRSIASLIKLKRRKIGFLTR